MKKSRQLFTIIELLIVIAIITILASLLMPALSSARKKALEIQCTGNMKQLGLGIGMYAGDYKGWLVPYRFSSSWNYWYMILGQNDYIPNNSYASSSGGDTESTILHCPASKTSEKGNYGTYYGLNNYFCNVPTSSTVGDTFLQIHKIIHPAQSILSADGKGCVSIDYQGGDPPYNVYWRHTRANANFLFSDIHVQGKSLRNAPNFKWKNH